MKKINKASGLLLLILALGLFLRWYRTADLLGFHYDQGRDAMVIRKFIKEGRPFLVGPVTGLEGIFLGPLLYIFLTPFYFLGDGDPVVPAMAISAIHLVAIYLLFYIGKKISASAGLLSAGIYAFSSNIVSLNRWLSNPPPIMITSLFLLFAFYQILQKKQKYWYLASLGIAASLQFEAASAVFYLPLSLFFVLWQWRNRPPLKTLLISIGIFLVFLLPQIAFDLRHNFIQSKNIYKTIVQEKSFSGSPSVLLKNRLKLYHYSFGNKLFSYDDKIILFALPLIFLFGIFTRRYWLSEFTKLLLLFIATPLVFYLFFQGNFGNVYDYHFSGYYPAFIILVSIWLTSSLSKVWGKAALAIFLSLFFYTNIPALNKMLTEDINGPISVFFTNQKRAVEFVYEDAGSNPFNVDVYVPPVIPHAYDYLFAWIGDKYKTHPDTNETTRLYTLYEPDPPHPERLDSWLTRQSTIGKIEETVSFGGITVNKRERFTHE